ncbi:MAG: glutathione S-transferase family protein, partial [Mesorhizobium sp.]
MGAAKTYRRSRRFASALYYRGTMLTLFHHPMFAT